MGLEPSIDFLKANIEAPCIFSLQNGVQLGHHRQNADRVFKKHLAFQTHSQ